MKNTTKTLVATALALALMAVPLAACSGQSESGGDSATDAAQGAPVDVSSLKTLGDVLSIEGEQSSASWTEEQYVCVVDNGQTIIRATADLTPELYERMGELDFGDDSYDEQLIDLIGGAPLTSVEDLTAAKIPQEELDALVGKTGQDLLDAGFTFASYYFYGGEETGAYMDNGMLTYDVTFDASITEADTEDGGAALTGATVTAISYAGIADSATIPVSTN